MSDFERMQALAKAHATLARTVNHLWELGWSEAEDGLLWEARQSLALVNSVLDGRNLTAEEAEEIRAIITDTLVSPAAMSAVIEGNALLSKLRKRP